MSMRHDSTTHPHPFGNIAALQEVFSETKKLRRTRHPSHVMVVEDDALTRRIVTGTFKDNYAMIAACDAMEAVADYLMHAPDVVFLDIVLPDTDGFTVLDTIMMIDPDAFIVMFSSNSYQENIDKALKAGAKGFVAKPFKKEMLRQYIQGSAIHHHKSS
jgi:two-component system chemotaxis response regulator CheY